MALLAIAALDYFQRTWSVVTFPYGWDYGESPELQRAISVAHGQPLYPFWNAPPYHMANYTPLFSLLNAPFVMVLGVQYQSGRAIAWLAGLGFGALLAWLAWRAGRRWPAPLVTALLWCSSHYVWNWTPLNREDDLAMLCSALGLLVVYETVARPAERCGATRAPPSPKVRWRLIWLALPCFLAAIYTRQTTIEAMAAASAYLLFRRPLLALRFMLLFAALAALIFVVLNDATRGAFFLNVVVGNQNVYNFGLAVYDGKEFWTRYQGAALLAIAYVAMQIARRRSMLFPLWLLATFAVGVTIGKDGAASNYGLLPWGAVSLCAGLAVAEAYDLALIWRQRAGFVAVRRVVVVVPALLVGFLLLLDATLSVHIRYTGAWRPERLAAANGLDRLVVGWSNIPWYVTILPMEPPPAVLARDAGVLYKPSVGAENAAEQAALDALVAATPGDVLDEDMTHLLLAGKRIYIQPFEFAEEARLGKWDPRPYVAAIAGRQFGLVILTRPVDRVVSTERFTPAMAAAIAAHYCLAQRTPDYYVYRPCAP